MFVVSKQNSSLLKKKRQIFFVCKNIASNTVRFVFRFPWFFPFLPIRCYYSIQTARENKSKLLSVWTKKRMPFNVHWLWSTILLAECEHTKKKCWFVYLTILYPLFSRCIQVYLVDLYCQLPVWGAIKLMVTDCCLTFFFKLLGNSFGDC